MRGTSRWPWTCSPDRSTEGTRVRTCSADGELLLADEGLDIDAWFDLWMIVVETDEGYGVGYFELEDPD